MLSKHFESKIGKYTLEDARADARLLLTQTEDRAYPLGRLGPLCDSDNSALHATVRSHYEHLRILTLGAAYGAQVLGAQALAAEATITMATAHADAVDTIGGGARALRDSLPLTITLPSLQRNSAAVNAISMKQLTKDLERDRLIVNGQYVVGAEKGLAGIQDILLAAIEQAILSFDGETRGVGKAALNALVLQTLAKASRTNSGGSSFLALQPLLAPGEQAMPLSDLATPLGVRVSVAALPLTPQEVVAPVADAAANGVGGNVLWRTIAPPKTSLALLCEIDCATYYRIQDTGTGMLGMMEDVDDDGSVHAPLAAGYNIEMKYQDSVYLHVNCNSAEPGGAPELGSRVLAGVPLLSILRYLPQQ